MIISGTNEGEQLLLTCTVSVVDHLVARPSIMWVGGSVGDSGVTENDTRAVNETASERTLIFSSLNTSHGGQYTCQAEIIIAEISLVKAGMDSTEVMVQSEFLAQSIGYSDCWLVCVCVCVCVLDCLSDIVPRPVVMVTASERELVSGSPLSLSCSILPPSVDTSIAISSNWTTPGGRHDTDNTTLVIYSVETADSGEYICSVTLSDSSGSQYVSESNEVSDTVSINVSK